MTARADQSPEPSRRAHVLLAAAGVVVVALLAIALIDRGEQPASIVADGWQADGSQDSASTAPSGPASDSTASGNTDLGQPSSVGDVNAPVLMVEYGDFQCPFCGVFARETLPTLMSDYVDSGRLRIEWRDVPYIGPESTRAATAGRAADAQGRFWEFYEAAYAEERTPNTGALSDDNLEQIAIGIGLDLDRFRADWNSAEAAAAVAAGVADADRLGLLSTPAFVINGELVIGAQPLATFTSIIDAALER